MGLNKFESFIEKHIDKNWLWGGWGLCSNPSLTMEFVEKHIDKGWNWGECGLSSNPFTLELKREKESRDRAARILQQGVQKLLWAPNHNGKPGLMVTKMLKELLELDENKIKMNIK